MEQDRQPDVVPVAIAFNATLDRHDLAADLFGASVRDGLRAKRTHRIATVFLCGLCDSVFQSVRVRAAFWKH
jgi:hypothetical protein